MRTANLRLQQHRNYVHVKTEQLMLLSIDNQRYCCCYRVPADGTRFVEYRALYISLIVLGGTETDLLNG